MSQNLKKETCTGECYPKCPIYNILQHRIGNWEITSWQTIEGMARHIQNERCPDGYILDQSNLHRARPDRVRH